MTSWPLLQFCGVRKGLDRACPPAPGCWSLLAHANPFPSPAVSLPLCRWAPASGSYSSERSAGPGWFWSLHSFSLFPHLSFLESWVWECGCNWNATLQNKIDLLTQDGVKLSSIILTGGILLLIPSSLKLWKSFLSCRVLSLCNWTFSSLAHAQVCVYIHPWPAVPVFSRLLLHMSLLSCSFAGIKTVLSRDNRSVAPLQYAVCNNSNNVNQTKLKPC